MINFDELTEEDPLFGEVLTCLHSKQFIEPPAEIPITELKICEMGDLAKAIYTVLKQKVPELQEDYETMLFGPDGAIALMGRTYITKYSEVQILEIWMWYLIRRQAKEHAQYQNEAHLHIRKGFMITMTQVIGINGPLRFLRRFFGTSKTHGLIVYKDYNIDQSILDTSLFMSILAPGIYDEKTPLLEDIDALADKNAPVTDEAIINLITKYFFAYIYPESRDQAVPFSYIDENFQRATAYCRESRVKGGMIMNITPEQELFYKKFSASGYGLTMLGDIAATTAIVKDIIKTQIDPKDFNDHYVGLDLGTGSGILLVAQYINALRNGFKSLENIGIEIDKTTAIQTCNIIDKLGIGKVFQGDTTQAQIYNLLNTHLSGPVTFLSNENIPTTGVAMTGLNDPFHQNNMAVYISPFQNDKITKYTKTFPSEISMTLKLGDSFEREVIGSNRNRFRIDALLQMEAECRKMYEETLPDEWRIFQEVHPNSIKLGDKMVPLHEVGKDLIDSGKVIYVADRRHRWSDKAIKAQEAVGAEDATRKEA